MEQESLLKSIVARVGDLATQLIREGELVTTRLRSCRVRYGVTLDDLPEWDGSLGELTRGVLVAFAQTQLNLPRDLVRLEVLGWQAIEEGIVRAGEGAEQTSRRIVCVQTRSVIEDQRLADYPSCIPVVQGQRLRYVTLITAYLRSSDVDILPLDLAWMYRVGRRLDPKRPIRVISFIANLHQYVDNLPSDGGYSR